MAIEHCRHGNSAPVETLEQLHDSQAGPGRHKCTVCAYAQGYRIGLRDPHLLLGNSECQEGFRAPTEMLEELPDSQAGAGRHKCCICAYHQGFQAGRAYAADHN